MGNVAHPDLLLARRAARNDPRAWEEIVALLGSRIYNLALRFAGSPGEAEELTQDVFLRLYRSLGQYRGDVPLLAWSLRLSRNLCIDHWRHHQKRLASEAPGEELSNSCRAAATLTGRPSGKRSGGWCTGLWRACRKPCRR